MQVGDNVYIDIRIKGSDKTDFISYDNMKELQLVETAGASLPYIFLSFFVTDKNIADLFMAKNKIEVVIGETVENASTFTVLPLMAPKNNDPSGNTWTITLGGFIGGDNAYMVNANISEAYNGNSLMVIEQVMKKCKHPLITNVEKINENQVTWRQTYQTTSAFVVDTLLHMDIRPSFPLFTFTKEGNFLVKDYDKDLKLGARWRFTPFTPSESGEIQYLNNFNTNSFQASYNLYSGYNKMTEIYGVTKGIPDYIIEDNLPVLASTEESEVERSGNRVALNRIQSDNVHKTYQEAYAYNTNKLLALSSWVGVLKVAGYHPELKPTDIVYVQTDSEKDTDSTLEGLYIIDSIVVSPSFTDGNVLTYVYITRDNKNNVENYVTEKPKDPFKIKHSDLQKLLNAVAGARTALAIALNIMDGLFVKRVLAYLVESKNNILRMFSFDSIMWDFTDKAMLLQGMLCSGNSIMNALMNMLLPEQVAYTLQNFLIDKPSLRYSASRAINEYVPFEIQSIVYNLVECLYSVHDALNSIATDHGITARRIPEVPTDNSSYIESESNVSNILQEFENNTTGLDIPFPVFTLTESQELLPLDDLRDYMAKETIANLTDLGYLNDLTDDETIEFNDILIGKTPINFTIINKINLAAGNSYNYRFWGTYGPTNEALYAWTCNKGTVFTKAVELSKYTRLYNSNYSPYMGTDFVLTKVGSTYYIMTSEGEEVIYLERDEDKDITSSAIAQLTDYYIGKGYKDRYRTLPCTKLISATQNARLYFACPAVEKDLKFYINSNRVIPESFDIDLGYTDVYGNKIMYKVYFTTTGYNSNSTMLEVRQG